MAISGKFNQSILGPFVTLLALFIIDIATRHAPPGTISLAIAFVPLALNGLIGDLRSSITCALFITGYTFIAPEYTLARAIQIVVASISVALASGYLKERLIAATVEVETNRQKAAAMNQLNGNLQKLFVVLRRLDELKDGWNILYEDSRLDAVNEVYYHIKHITTLVSGWHQLWVEAQEVTEADDRKTK
jgi:hypothetical protein